MQRVCNASPLIFLAKIDLIHVLPTMIKNLKIPLGVYHEMKGKVMLPANGLKRLKRITL